MLKVLGVVAGHILTRLRGKNLKNEEGLGYQERMERLVLVQRRLIGFFECFYLNGLVDAARQILWIV